MSDEPFTDEQKENLRRVYAKASALLAESKRKAVESGDFEQSLGIASREAQVEAYLRKQGVDLESGT